MVQYRCRETKVDLDERNMQNTGSQTHQALKQLCEFQLVSWHVVQVVRNCNYQYLLILVDTMDTGIGWLDCELLHKKIQ